MSGFTAVGYFLASLVLGLTILALWLRIALRYLKFSTLSPLGKLVGTLTDPIVNPIASVFHLKYKPGQRFDVIAIVLLVLVECIKITLLCLLRYKSLFPLPYLILYVIADLIIQPCNLLFYAILIRVIMSYLNPNWQHPIADFLRALTEPLLILGRKIIPDISGFDFSPLIILILLEVITLFISASLPWQLL